VTDDTLARALLKSGRRSFSLHLASSEGLRVVETPLPPEEYAGRRGYRPDFIDPAHPVPLPEMGRWEDDLAEVDPDWRDPSDPHVLHYEHFSVKVSPLEAASPVQRRQRRRPQ
jgi:hypothetical protein